MGCCATNRVAWPSLLAAAASATARLRAAPGSDSRSAIPGAWRRAGLVWRLARTWLVLGVRRPLPRAVVPRTWPLTPKIGSKVWWIEQRSGANFGAPSKDRRQSSVVRAEIGSKVRTGEQRYRKQCPAVRAKIGSKVRGAARSLGAKFGVTRGGLDRDLDRTWYPGATDCQQTLPRYITDCH